MSAMALLLLGTLAALTIGSVVAGYAVAAVSWWLAQDRSSYRAGRRCRHTPRPRTG
ncbi:hypothetical protein [Nocardia sp. AG03]|uniref:hypothetical protein n=1 Tax=Nocardia sp. AG03 TaxID=3025312 RepID=UPI00241844AA|nr:hypothetical protein [Nocardia sp. AG03]